MSKDDQLIPLPPEAVDVAIQTVTEIIGESGAKTILKQVNMETYWVNGKLNPEIQPTFGDVGRVSQALINIYGERGAAALLKRAGRVQFLKWKEAYPAAIGIAGVALKALSPKSRLKTILKAVSSAAKHIADVDTEIEETEGSLVFRTHQCPYCSGIETYQPFCTTAIGALDEVCRWATGQTWQIAETECRANGAASCTFLLTPPEP